MTFINNKLILATHNEGKISEFKQLLSFTDLEISSAAEYYLEEPEETGMSFEENAAIKALYVAEKTGKVALSDDSGLCIEALNGAPGIYTSNWAESESGQRDFTMAMEKIEHKLREVSAISPKDRQASFISVLCLAWPDGKKLFFKGEVKGEIIWPPRGELGFGLDPIFLPEGEKRTFGEMSSIEKHSWRPGAVSALSHRAKAFKQFTEKLFFS
ncbi:RdgB/HAM1 family non-canonical purine NTP pyrophosphatase [Bartonella sp. DGB1]|uniref:RdgB/HAM1 family non-canonical purine NTP pyrophosphatase n=1 Tax=Bartonella sp. DGB1 TaxID=3239807 RepID=UPI0035266D38